MKRSNNKKATTHVNISCQNSTCHTTVNNLAQASGCSRCCLARPQACFRRRVALRFRVAARATAEPGPAASGAGLHSPARASPSRKEAPRRTRPRRSADTTNADLPAKKTTGNNTMQMRAFANMPSGQQQYHIAPGRTCDTRPASGSALGVISMLKSRRKVNLSGQPPLLILQMLRHVRR